MLSFNSKINIIIIFKEDYPSTWISYSEISYLNKTLIICGNASVIGTTILPMGYPYNPLDTTNGGYRGTYWSSSALIIKHTIGIGYLGNIGNGETNTNIWYQRPALYK